MPGGESRFPGYGTRSCTHLQSRRVVRDLTARGWTVTITANAERRDVWKFPSRPDAYTCRVENPDYPGHVGERKGRLAWDAIKSLVEEVVEPAEEGKPA